MIDPLRLEIAERVASEGPLAFADYMRLCLYHPAHGFYSKRAGRIGMRGDFFTNVSTGPLFGELLARQFMEMWEFLGCPELFTLIEQGADSGQLSADILAAAQNLEPGFAAALEYGIVEPLAPLREAQRETLADFATKVRWHASNTEIDGVSGIHFSNELVDALPFHVIVRRGGRWLEKRVTTDSRNHPAWTECELGNGLAAAVAKLPLPDIEGYTTEVRPAMRPWLEEAAATLEKGWILLCDYGMSSAEYYAPHRRDGTLSCYRNHRRDANPLENPGAKDITAHVDFSSLAADAADLGLGIAGWADQCHFLTGVAENWLHSLDGITPDSATTRKLRAFTTLTHPESMGKPFKFLCLAKNAPLKPHLAGFKWAPPGELFAPVPN